MPLTGLLLAPFLGESNTLERIKRRDRDEEKRQAYAVKGGLFTLSVDGGRRVKEGRTKKRKEEQRKGRVGEEDRAGGEGESEDSCVESHTLNFRLSKRVSKE